MKRQKNNINGTVGSPAIKIIVFVLFTFGVGREIDFSLSEKLFANIVIIFWILKQGKTFGKREMIMLIFAHFWRF